MKTTFLHFVDQANNDVAGWFYCRDQQCIRVHVFGIPGWTYPALRNAVIDDFGDLVCVD